MPQDPGMNQYPRYNVTVSISSNDGKSWPHRKVVFPADIGMSTYATVRMTADNMIAVHFDTMQTNNCRKRIRNVTCATKLASVPECVACAMAAESELTARIPPARARSYCPSALYGWDDFGPNDGGASGVQPNPEAFLAAAQSACGPLSYPESPDGTLLALIDPAEILRGSGDDDDGGDAAPNATVALQTMLDGGADVTVGPRAGAEPSWLVGPMRFTRSHQRVTFLPGTLVYAANDSFHGKDGLFGTVSTNWTDPAAGVVNLTIVGYGATWRMRRQDYAKTGSGKSNGWYSVSEDRHGLSIAGAVAVTVEGLTIEDTGGDGIYVQTVYGLTVRHLMVNAAYRNAISVIAADGLLVEHSVFMNTRGTDPEAGCDIEPNACIPGRCHHVNVMHAVVFRNCSFINNFGGGILVSLGGNLGNTTKPIGVRFDDCRVNGTGTDAPPVRPPPPPMPSLLQPGGSGGSSLILIEQIRERVGLGGANPNAVVIGGPGGGSTFVNSGEISFTNLSVANASGGAGITIANVPATGWAQVVIDGLTVEAVGYDPNSRPEALSPVNVIGDFDGQGAARAGGGGGGVPVPTGGITIRNAVVKDDSARPYIRLVDPNGFRHLVFVNATVINPFGCAAYVEAGHPLEELAVAKLSPSNISLEGVVCVQ